MDRTVYYTLFQSPVDELLLGGCPEGLTLVVFQHGKKARTPDPGWRETREPFRETIRQLQSYFGGELLTFDLPLIPQGTPFQLRVWEQLVEIPYGETRTYGQIAHTLGQPTASRAVGAANGRNPLPIVVPCHRVIGGDGSLTGFGGGLPAKQALLNLERAHVAKTPGRMTLS